MKPLSEPEFEASELPSQRSVIEPSPRASQEPPPLEAWPSKGYAQPFSPAGPKPAPPIKPQPPGAKAIASEGSPSLIFFWISAFLGTCIAGAVFGGGVMVIAAAARLDPSLLVPAIFTTFIGCMYAGCVGIFMVPSIAVLSWAAFLDRRMPWGAAALAGGCTGAICGLPAGSIAVVTGLMGAVGAAVFGHLAIREHRVALRIANNDRFSFSLRDLFMRMTAISMLIAGWMFVIRFALNL